MEASVLGVHEWGQGGGHEAAKCEAMLKVGIRPWDGRAAGPRRPERTWSDRHFHRVALAAGGRWPMGPEDL